MIQEKKSKQIHFDPRTKMFIMILTVFAATMAPSTTYLFALTFLIAFFACFCGKYKLAVGGVLGYSFFYLLTIITLNYGSTAVQGIMMAFLGLVHKVYSCGFMGAIIIKSTKISEFLSGMNKLHFPKSFTITLAIMLRYIPTIKEDWHFIKDAMRLRDVAPSLVNFIREPMLTIECVYAPLLLAASKAADELTIASVTRGIENPIPRTSYVHIYFGIADAIISIVFIAFFVFGQFL